MPGPRSAFTPRETVERPADPAVRRANLRRIGRLFREYRLKLTVVSALIVFSSLLGVVSPFLLRDILDTAIPDQNMALLSLLAGGMIADLARSPARSASSSRTSRRRSARA